MSEILAYDIPILERLEKSFIFSSDEIKRILRNRNHYEDRLSCKEVSSKTFLRYLSFEMRLNYLLVRRCESAAQGFFLRKNPFQLRVMHLFKRAIHKYPSDTKLWFAFIHYCRVFLRKKKIFSKVIASALRFCPNSSGLWSYAISIELEDNNMSGARVLAQRGLRSCSYDERLWLKYIDFELGYASLLRERRNCVFGAGTSDYTDFNCTHILSRSVIENAIRYYSPNKNAFVVKVLRICSKYVLFVDLDIGIQKLILDNFDSQPEFLLRLLDSENCMLRVLLYIYDICFLNSTKYDAVATKGETDVDYLTKMYNITRDVINFSYGLDFAQVSGKYFAIETFSFKVIMEGIVKQKSLWLLHVLECAKTYAILSSILINETLSHIGFKTYFSVQELNSSSKCGTFGNMVKGSDMYPVKNRDEIRFLVEFSMVGR